MTIFQDLCVKDIPILSNPETLYTFDPRSILDECLGKHRYLVSCENLLTNILYKQQVVVNQYAIKHGDPDRNNWWTAFITGDPRIPLYIRMNDLTLPDSIKNLFVAVPHPEADKLAMEKGWNINFTYPDFLTYNNKISQKELLGNLTPDWELIDPKVYVFNELDDCYFKRDLGAGGYATFHSSDLTGMKLPSRKYPSRWFKEATQQGDPRSVQIVRHGPGSYTVFGYSDMKIVAKKNYAGGLMKRTDCLTNMHRDFISSALERLDSLFKGYTGFMGLDFLEQTDRLFFLEANVRVTMATFATLQLNESSGEQLEFYRFK